MKHHSGEFERNERDSAIHFGDVRECDRYFVECTHNVDSCKEEEVGRNHECEEVYANQERRWNSEHGSHRMVAGHLVSIS